MKLNYFEYNTTNEIKEISDKCYKLKLFVPNWSFCYWLSTPCFTKKVVVCKDENKYIGLAIQRTDDWPMCGVYVKPKYRRNGIGTELMKLLVGGCIDKNDNSNSNKNTTNTIDEGVKGSKTFYKKCIKKRIKIEFV